MMKVIVLDGDMAGRDFPLLYDFTSIGREEGVDIHIPVDTSISRRHAVIRREKDKFILEDLNSTNGTYLIRSGGQEDEIIHTMLSDGTIFRVGKTTLKMVEGTQDIAIETKEGERMEVVSDSPDDFAIRSSVDPSEIYSTSFLTAPEDPKSLTELNHKIKIFYDIGMALGKIMDLDDLLHKILEHIFEMFPAQRGYLMLLDEKNNELETRVVKRREIPGEGTDTISKKAPKDGVATEENDKIEVSKTIINHVMIEKKSVLSDDARHDERFGMADSVFLHDIRATMYSPLILEQKVIGILSIDSFTSSHVFTENDLRLFSIIANQAAQSIANARLHMNVRRLLLSSIKALANAIEARDVYTRGHSERVTEFSVRIAEALDMEKSALEKIRFAALLHDIGKIKVPGDVLNKPGRLTDDEFRIIKEHPGYGARILEPVEEFREILPYVYHHHERFDGKGYPDGLKGEEIPLPSRILAVADSFDAMTSDRPYREPLSLEEAVTEMKKNSGTQFDPGLIEIFLNIIEHSPEWMDQVIKKTPVAFMAEKKIIDLTGTREFTDNIDGRTTSGDGEKNKYKSLTPKPARGKPKKGTIEIKDLIREAKNKILHDEMNKQLEGL